MFLWKFYKIFKNNFSLGAIGATASESSSQVVCLAKFYNKYMKMT